MIRPAGELRGGARPLHRRPAQPEGRGRATRSGRFGVPRLPRPPDHRPARDRGPPRRTWRRCSATLAERPAVPRSSLYLAWDFTVASADSLTGRATAHARGRIRRLGDTDLSNLTDRGHLALVHGDRASRTTPADPDLIGGSRRHDHASVLPQPTGARPARLRLRRRADMTPTQPGNDDGRPLPCMRPARGRDDDEIEPARAPSLYGHGLLGAAERGHRRQRQARWRNEHNFDLLRDGLGRLRDARRRRTSSRSLHDLSNFPKLVDRTQQGFINFMYLGRADDPPGRPQHRSGVPGRGPARGA